MLRTVSFLKEVFQVLAQEHDREDFPATLVGWFCEHFGVDRCSLMLLDDSQETMRIAAQRGIAPEVAGGVRVRVGQGIAGWVAHNRKPLLRPHEGRPGGGLHAPGRLQLGFVHLRAADPRRTDWWACST